MTPEIARALIFWFPAFLFSSTCHEAAHAWAALKGGDDTAARAGQVSLSPWPHIRRAPFGMIVLPLLTSVLRGWTLGWASAPYDAAWADRHPRRAAFMAAAGPLANVLLAAAAFALLRAGLVAGLFDEPGRVTLDQLVVAAPGVDPTGVADFCARGLSVLLSLNALLAAFNLLPVPPLDGAAVVTLIMPTAAARRVRQWCRVPGLSFVGLLAAWQFAPVLAKPVFDAVVTLLHPGRY